MKPVHQTILHAPRGNCFSACLASLLEVGCDDVPNIHDFGDEWFYPLNKWLLETHRLVLLMITASTYRSALWLPDEVPFIATCDVGGGWRHAVVMTYRGMEAIVLHDPLPEGGANQSGPVYMYFLVKP